MSRLRPNVNNNTILHDDDSFLQRKPFENYVICCTGLSSATKQALYSQVDELGGRIQPDFTNAVTHLIADKVGSEKYKAAIRCKVPILTPSWAEQCFEHFKNNEKFEPSTISKLHVLPPLAGCCICVTGLSGEEREAVEKMTIENGGEYSPALTMPCTHLIVKIPEGRKFQAAVKRNLHTVNLDWLYECTKQKVCVNEDLYPVLANSDTMPATSNIRKPGTLSQDRQRLLRESKNSTMYLDGCNIYLGDGFGPEKMMLMKKIIVDGGGSRHSDFIECVTHFVTSSSTLTEKDKDILRHATKIPTIVHSKWLQDCYRDCTLHPTDKYSIEYSEEGASEKGRSQFSSGTKNHNQRATLRKNSMPAGSSMAKSKSFWEDLAEDMKQEPRPDANNATNSHLLQRSASTTEVKASERIPTFEKRTKSLTPHCRSQEPLIDPVALYSKRTNGISDISNGSNAPKQPTKSGIFSGYFFFCESFPTDQKHIVEQVVLDNGGSFHSTFPHTLSAEPEKYFRIVPLKVQQSGMASLRFKTATECWLESCIDEQRLIPLEEKVIYSPIKIQFPIKEFQNYHIGITGYTELEREHIGRLCITLGARFSERFSKKYTHLICKQKSGEKYRRAVEWGIPVVDSNWIFDIARNGINSKSRSSNLDETKTGDSQVVFDGGNPPRSNGNPLGRSKENFLAEQLNEDVNQKNYINYNTTNGTNGNEHNDPTISSRPEGTPTLSVANGTTATPMIKKYGTSIVSATTIDTPHHNTFLGKKDFRPQFDTTGILSSLKTPEGPHTPVTGITLTGPASTMTPGLTSANLKFDTTAALNALMSPGTAPNTLSKSAVTPFFQRIQGNAISSTPGTNGCDSPLDHTFSRNISLALGQVETPGSVHGSGQVLFSNTPDISNMDSTAFFEEANKSHSELNDISFLLRGVTIYVSQRLAHRRNELCDLAREMGAQSAWIFDESCTHLVHQSNKVAENFKDFKLAKQKGKMIVSPIWLQKCKEFRTRVDERDYPHTYAPNKSHLVTSNMEQRSSQSSDQDSVLATQIGFRKHVSIASANTPSTDSKSNSDEEFLKPNASVIEKLEYELDTKDPSTTKKQTPEPPKVNYAAAVEELIGRMSTDKKRRRARSSFGMLRSSTEQASDQGGLKQDTSFSDISAISGKTASLFDISADANTPEPPDTTEINSTQEPVAVMYDDPEGRREKRKLLDRLLMNKRLRISPNDESESENDTSNGSSIKPQTNIVTLSESEDSLSESNLPDKFMKQSSIKSERTISDISAPNEQKTSSNKEASALPKVLDLHRLPTSIMDEMIQDEANGNEESDPTSSRRSNRISAQTSDNNMLPKQRTSPKFLLSSMSSEFKNRLMKTIRRLGGVTLNTDQWTSECTHLIVGYPSRSEKFLAACASGVWVLKPSFVDSSVLNDGFVAEEVHEWTAESDIKPEDKLLVGAAQRWRLKLQELQAVNAEIKGSFTGWNVLLVVENKKREGFVRLLQAGNAEVNVARAPFRNIATENLTHVFVEPSKTRTLPNHFVHTMLEAKVPCLETDFIVEFLTKDEDADQNQFWIKHPALQKKRKV